MKARTEDRLWAMTALVQRWIGRNIQGKPGEQSLLCKEPLSPLDTRMVRWANLELVKAKLWTEIESVHAGTIVVPLGSSQ